MPFSSNESLPKGVKGLPEDQQSKWRKVFNAAYEGSCKDRGDKRDECASKIAWSQIGDKYKKDALTEFSMALRSVTHDKKAGTLRWKAVASDTDEDYYHDNMSLELFDDFTKRIAINELAPEDFRSTFWQGGMPYISVSHYPDLEGKAVPGSVERVFVDGNQLKADGQFLKTSLGFACYYAICKDLYEEEKPENPVRVSIAFLDFGHTHKSDNYRFVRDGILDFCPKCIEERIKGETSGKIFEKGQLVHLALTRVPANERTSMEVDKSMTTRKEDAASIVGEELAEEFEQEAALIGKSQALVIKSEEEEITEEQEISDDEVELIEESTTEPEVKKYYDEDPVPVVVVSEPKEYKPFGGATSMKMAKDFVEAQKEQWRISDLWWAFQGIMENIQNDENLEDKASAIAKAASELKEMIGDKSMQMYAILTQKSEVVTPKAQEHELDTVFSEFKSAYDEIKIQPVTADEKLQQLQEFFSKFGQEIRARMYEIEPEPEQQAEKSQADLVQALSQVMQPIANKLDMILTRQQDMVKSPVEKATPVRRSITPTLSMQADISRQKPVQKVQSSTPKLRALIEQRMRNS